MGEMESYTKLLLNNRIWAQDKVDVDPNYFKNLAKDQKPEFLWIGCADSRVPANEIIGAEPGELFVHRNIASLVVSTDMNLLSVLQYAVENLKVQHVIVCGHYGCGGIKAAVSNQDFGMLNKWLHSIKDVYHHNRVELEALPDAEARHRRLVELVVREQVYNLAKTSIIQKAWKRDRQPMLHGWVYGLEDGLLKEVMCMEADTDIAPVYRYLP